MKKNLITVLKKLLAAFGGEETQSNNAVEIIDEIADNIDSGSELFVATIRSQPQTGPKQYYHCDKTNAEIREALSNNRPVIFIIWNNVQMYITATVHCPFEAGSNIVYVTCGNVGFYNDRLMVYNFQIPDGSTTETDLEMHYNYIMYEE